MDRKAAIHNLLGVIAFAVLSFIKGSEATFEDRWVPATHVAGHPIYIYMSIYSC